MRLAIVGSRTFNNKRIVENIIKEFANDYKDLEIVSGGAKGADSLAEQVANDMGLKFTVFLPLFKRDKTVPYNPKWFFERNKEIVDYSDMIVAIWDFHSKGTEHAIKYARKKKKMLKIVCDSEGLKSKLDTSNVNPLTKFKRS